MTTMRPQTLALYAIMLLFLSNNSHGSEQLDRIISMTGGASTLTYNINTTMKNTGILATGVGKVQARLRRKGAAINERLGIALLGLTPNSTYQLTAFIGDNTNSTNLNGFTTNAKGAFTSSLQSNGGSSNPALLNALGVLSNVREIDVVNSAGLAVLQADMIDPKILTSVLSRKMDNAGFLAAAAGSIQVRASQKMIRFQFQGAGFTALTAYQFNCNGLINQKYTSDKNGKLRFNLTVLAAGSPDTSLDVFDIHELSVSDGATGSIVLRVGDTQPIVISTVPANAATGVAVNQTLTATFSKPMDPNTINATTFTLQQGATPIPGTVTYSGVTATFTLASNLPPNTTFTATITTGASDIAGAALSANYVWTFTTVWTSNGAAPRVIATAPLDNATNVSINRKMTATFDQTMDPATLNSTTFTVQQGSTLLGGSVTSTGATAAFTPSSNLPANTLFVATITAGAKNPSGAALASDFTWSFTTGTTADNTPPTVLSTNPINNATNVAINQSVNATFSESMDPQTIVSANFKVTGPGATPVAGTVAYDLNSNIGTFTPGSTLAPSTLFTATVSTGVTDLAGNALVSAVTWTFTTGTQMNQSKVALGSAGNFATLAGSTVTSVGPTVLNGDLGVSPGTAVTGFPPGKINGAIHAGDNTAAQAKVDLLAAYNDGAARMNPAVLPGNLGGLTLTPGLYKTGSSSGINGTGPQAILTLDAQGDANAVFIFQIASTLITTVGTQVVLSGGAKATNIYWQVGSSATLGTNSIFKGNVLADQSITVTTGVVLEGRVLTRVGAVTLDSNTITAPAP